tara:strand:+ start:256 stop:1371 length:1116 start_codon:yes stop_codon:yes gene_type:complete
MNKNIITFVFQSGRTSRINNEKEEFSKEFFYSYQNFKTEFDKVNLIEFNNPKSFFNLITRPLFRALRYLTTIPFYCENIQSVKNYRILSNSDEIIFTNQRVAFSSMPMLLLSSIFKKKRSTVFIMGLFVEQSKNSVRKFFRLNFIKLLVKISSNLIFLSSSEKELASSIFPKNKEKMFFLPFPVDTYFWSKEKAKNNSKNTILFIGNDGKRDYELVTNIAKEMVHCNFIFVSKQIDKKLLSENVELLEGKWADNEITDSEIRDIYNNSILSIIPLKNSHQPSGQSVALQSMSMKVPVIISKTSGFWDYTKFSNEENIVFIDENTTKDWVNKIDYLISNQNLRNNISESAFKTIEKDYTLEKFYSSFKEIVF